MAQIVLDTDVLIEILRGTDLISRRLEELQRQGNHPGYSPVTVAELWQGIRPSEERLTERFLAQMTCLEVSGVIGRMAGRYLQRYRRSHGLTLPDALIAATAILHHSSLWTFNRRHYPMRELTLL